LVRGRPARGRHSRRTVEARSSFSREDREASTLQGLHGPKCPLVERDDTPGAVPSCENDQRHIGQSEFQIPVTTRQPARHADLVTPQTFEDKRSLRQIVEEGKLGVDAQTA